MANRQRAGKFRGPGWGAILRTGPCSRTADIAMKTRRRDRLQMCRFSPEYCLYHRNFGLQRRASEKTAKGHHNAWNCCIILSLNRFRFTELCGSRWLGNHAEIGAANKNIPPEKIRGPVVEDLKRGRAQAAIFRSMAFAEEQLIASAIISASSLLMPNRPKRSW